MGWRKGQEEEQRSQFIRDWKASQGSLSRLCRQYGISRPTAYKWIAREQREGEAGLVERSRAPHHHPRTPSWEMQDQIVAQRHRHPDWGAPKILAVLREQAPDEPWPAESTVGEILKRAGLIRPATWKGEASPTCGPLTPMWGCNQVWSIDFKGWFRTGDGGRCYPLTVQDGYSRYLLECEGLERTGEGEVRKRMEALFRAYGLPEVIRSDNGAPFASHGLAGLTRLSVQWIRLGIVPERIRPGRPQQNGRHERMHRTLKAATQAPPERTLREQQKRFDAFRREYNEERPHEALGQVPPARIYRPSPRLYPSRLPEMDYEEGVEVRTVWESGEIGWRGYRIFLSEALREERVALEPVDERFWLRRYGPVPLGKLDGKSHCLRTLTGRRKSPFY